MTVNFPVAVPVPSDLYNALIAEAKYRRCTIHDLLCSIVRDFLDGDSWFALDPEPDDDELTYPANPSY